MNRKMKLAIIAWGFAAVTAFSAIVAPIQYAHHQQTVRVAATIGERNHFYRVIGGIDPAGVTVDDRLASDLKSLLGPTNSKATSLPPEILTFRGNSNAYGGIASAIGTDPFDESGLVCTECGPLDEQTQAKLLLVKRGQIQSALDPVPKVTPFSLFFVVALYLVAGASAALIWFQDVVKGVLRKKKTDELLWKRFGPTMSLVDQFDQLGHELEAMGGGRKQRELMAARNDLMKQLEKEARTGSANPEVVEQKMTDLLDSLQYVLKERRELRGWDNGS